MYKDLRGILTKTLRTRKSGKKRTHKKNQMYETMRTQQSTQLSFVHPNLREIKRTCTSIILHPLSSLNHTHFNMLTRRPLENSDLREGKTPYPTILIREKNHLWIHPFLNLLQNVIIYIIKSKKY